MAQYIGDMCLEMSDICDCACFSHRKFHFSRLKINHMMTSKCCATLLELGADANTYSSVIYIFISTKKNIFLRKVV
jgi:hypothetical protein